MTPAEVEQRRRNVRVLELIGESYAARTRGDRAREFGAMDEAYQVDIDAVIALLGGMRISEVPFPGKPGWHEYLDAQRDGLARAEAELAASTVDGGS